MIEVIYKKNKPYVFVAFKVYFDYSTIKPYYVKTYCGCKCVKVNESGGIFRLCPLHADSIPQRNYGDVCISRVIITIPITKFEKLKVFLKYYISIS